MNDLCNLKFALPCFILNAFEKRFLCCSLQLRPSCKTETENFGIRDLNVKHLNLVTSYMESTKALEECVSMVTLTRDYMTVIFDERFSDSGRNGQRSELEQKRL